jgi:hypothetical protein
MNEENLLEKIRKEKDYSFNYIDQKKNKKREDF